MGISRSSIRIRTLRKRRQSISVYYTECLQFYVQRKGAMHYEHSAQLKRTICRVFLTLISDGVENGGGGGEEYSYQSHPGLFLNKILYLDTFLNSIESSNSLQTLNCDFLKFFSWKFFFQ